MRPSAWIARPRLTGRSAHRPRQRELIRLAVASAVLPLIVLTGCAAAPTPEPEPTGSGTSSGSGSGVDVEKMIGRPNTGSPYFSDPYPVYRAQHGTSVADPHIVFGTPPAALLCPGPVRPGCYRRSPIQIQLSPTITAQTAADGTVIVATQNHNPFQSDTGTWDMALTVSVRTNPAQPAQPKAEQPDGHWSVVLHAHPTGPTDPVPTTWVADSVLEGSLAQDQRANYDGKYYESAGRLYLLYSKRLIDTPASDGVVAQLMDSPVQPAASAPVVLLAPTTGTGFSSEDFFLNAPQSQFKLVETGNISTLGGKYVMAYSTGAFNENDYKTGLAWSDTFLPAGGATYQKLVSPDPSNLWHDPGHQDVAYLLQSQQLRWVHFVGAKVSAPGVPSIVQDANNTYLIFAGYLPNPANGTQTAARFDPTQRQPLLISLCPSGTAAMIEPCTR